MMGSRFEEEGKGVAGSIKPGGRMGGVTRVLSREREAAWWGKDRWGPRSNIH